MTFNICAHIVSRILYVDILFCVKCLGRLNIFIHDDNLVLVSEFVEVIILSRVEAILSEWWTC